jgi:hypothetical protein
VPKSARRCVTLSPIQELRTSSTPRYAVAFKRARDGTEYQAPSILSIVRELISTGIGLRTSKLVAGNRLQLRAFLRPYLTSGSAGNLPGRERRIEFG